MSIQSECSSEAGEEDVFSYSEGKQVLLEPQEWFIDVFVLSPDGLDE